MNDPHTRNKKWILSKKLLSIIYNTAPSKNKFARIKIDDTRYAPISPINQSLWMVFFNVASLVDPMVLETLFIFGHFPIFG
jgi:hypothetical protein